MLFRVVEALKSWIFPSSAAAAICKTIKGGNKGPLRAIKLTIMANDKMTGTAYK